MKTFTNFAPAAKKAGALLLALAFALAPVAPVTVSATHTVPTSTTLNPITSPLTPGQTNVAWSGVVTGDSLDEPVQPPNNATINLQVSSISCSSGFSTIATDQLGNLDPDVPAQNRAWDGTFTAPASAGTYYFRATFPTATGGSHTWTGSNSSCQTIVVGSTTGTLTLQKSVVKDNGGTAVDTDWTLSASGPTPITGVEGDASITAKEVTAGPYNLSESGGPAGYTPSAWVCTGTGTQNDSDTVTLAAGQTATCIITNDDIAPSLTLVKQMVNDGGGSATATDWTLTATGSTTISGAGGVSSDATFDAGTYTLSESAGPTGYGAGSWACTGVQNTGTSITLGLGQSATCNITNTYVPPGMGTIVVEKHVTEGSNTQTAFDFAGSLGAFSLSHGQSTSSNLLPGQYSISEATTTGWSQTNVACVSSIEGTENPASIQLTAGETVTCIFTNTEDTNPAPTATITGHKFNDANNNGVQDEGEGNLSGWTIEATVGSSTYADVTDSEGNYTIEVPEGSTGSVSEVQQSGWTQSAPQGGTCSFTEIQNSDEFSCVFGNHQNPIITTDGGGGGGSGKRISLSDGDGEVAGASDEKPVPEVAGAQTAILPAGAPNAGAGGAAENTAATTAFVGSFMLMLAGAFTLRRSKMDMGA